MELPALLAGPIMRRVETAHIHLWTATSSPFEFEADIYRIIQSESGQEQTAQYQTINTITKTNTIRAGDNLYIHMIKVIPETGTFPPDTLLGYNLLFKSSMGQFDLGSLGMLSPENPGSIVYGHLKYPTFFIQQNGPTNLLYGSCRKPHGKGSDAFEHADTVIQADCCNLQNRPSHLFLMGDQIYADDVADPIFPVIAFWSRRLFGTKVEDLSSIDGRLEQQPFQKALDQVHGRQYITERFCKFTSSHAANHLLRFSEYAAMYLLTLSPALWESGDKKDAIPDFQTLINTDAVYFKYPDTPHHQRGRKKEWKKHSKRYAGQRAELLAFIQTLPDVRRVLANTPTYMIFDDHDITDDWNISATWKEDVWQAPLGRHTIANGLSAYWLFQGWGNDPDGCDASFQSILANHLQNVSHTSPLYDQWIDQLWQFPSWHFTAPTNPQTLFLDTRTKRAYDLSPIPTRIGSKIEESKRTAELIGPKGWDDLAKALTKSKWSRGDPLILVSPTPLYGIGIIESFLYQCVYPFQILGLSVRYDLDFEAWKYNGKGFNRFIQQLAAWQPNPCIILSGDVHYGNAVSSKVRLTDDRHLDIHQFTSSPVNNMSFSGLWGRLLKIAVWFNARKRKKRILHRCCDTNNLLRLGKKKFPQNHSIKWQEEIQYHTDPGGSIIDTRNNIGLLHLTKNKIDNKRLT